MMSNQGTIRLIIEAWHKRQARKHGTVYNPPVRQRIPSLSEQFRDNPGAKGG